MTSKDIRELENLKMDILEELEISAPSTPCCLFYRFCFGHRYLIDYEVAETSLVQYKSLLSDKDKKAYLESFKKDNPLIVNIKEDGEEIDLVSLKELIYIIEDILSPEASSDVKAIKVNLFINGMSAYRLAQELKVSKQTVSQYLTGAINVPDARKKEISELLDFSMNEYNREATEYLFDCNL